MAERLKRENNIISRIPFIVSILFIIISPLENIYRIERYVYIIGVVILSVCLLLNKSFSFNNSKLWLIFIFYAFITCFWSESFSAYSTLVTMCAEVFFLIFQLQFSYSSEDFRKIKIAFIVQSWFLLFLCARYGRYIDSRLWLQSDYSGADPNYLSGWFIIPLCFAVEFLVSSKTKIWVKAILLIQTALSFYYIMQTSSRSGLIATVLVVAIATVYSFRHTLAKYPIRAVFILIVFGIAIAIGIRNMPSYLIKRLSTGDFTLTGRTVMWQKLALTLLQNPLRLLFGFGTSAVALYTGNGMVSHNTFLDILFNHGIIGLSAMLMFMFGGIRQKWKSRPYVVIALVGMSVLVCTLSAFNTRFLMLMFFLIGADVVENKSVNEDYMTTEDVLRLQVAN